jgi:hypothetical protein
LSTLVLIRGIAGQILSSLRLIPLPTDNFWFVPAFSYQLQNLHFFIQLVRVDVWTRHLGVTIETRPYVGAVSFQGSLLLDSLIALEQYSGASSQNGVFITPNIFRKSQRERGMSTRYLHLSQTKCNRPSETSSAGLFRD